MSDDELDDVFGAQTPTPRSQTRSSSEIPAFWDDEDESDDHDDDGFVLGRSQPSSIDIPDFPEVPALTREVPAPVETASPTRVDSVPEPAVEQDSAVATFDEFEDFDIPAVPAPAPNVRSARVPAAETFNFDELDDFDAPEATSVISEPDAPLGQSPTPETPAPDAFVPVVPDVTVPVRPRPEVAESIFGSTPETYVQQSTDPDLVAAVEPPRHPAPVISESSTDDQDLTYEPIRPRRRPLPIEADTWDEPTGQRSAEPDLDRPVDDMFSTRVSQARDFQEVDLDEGLSAHQEPWHPDVADDDEPRRKPRQRQGDSSSRSGLPLKKIGTVAASLALVGALGFGVMQFTGDDGGEKQTNDTSQVADPRAAIQVQEWDGSGPPGFADTALYDIAIIPGAVVAATANGTLIVEGQQVYLLPTDDSVIVRHQMPAKVDWVIGTKFGDTNAISWRSGNAIYFMDPKNPGATPHVLPVAPEAVVTSAGDHLMAQIGSQTFVTHNGAWQAVEVPARAAEATPMAVDDAVIAGDASGNVWRIGYGDDTGEADSFTLESPKAGMKLSKWLTAGSGMTVTVWRKPGETKVNVAVHSAEDGTLISQHDVDGRLIADSSWVRGQGRALAALGPLLYDARTGKLVLDASSKGITFSRPLGSVAIGADEQGPLVFEIDDNGAIAWRTDIQLAGADDFGNALVLTDIGTISVFGAPI